ncbi:spermidine/putrescine transport system permease protein [Marinobacter nauticus]|jgi:spermidine/putrescine transport system permease protein|uniref:Spermidine/putrescine transport system permease protein n=1 Tax=Marinobacter nauticus TaxID=2743 RepID=A0A368XPF0_MARNT|nr:ABC transporter permease [Marinobacter nauticus]RCW69890.1 spermidine/putrescine transport system permease protein [Marinobacter nauticus]
MIRSVPRSRLFDALYLSYLLAFFLYLALPLLVTAVFAFNDSPFPSLPWQGFTLDWYLADGTDGRTGLFHDDGLLSALWVSTKIAFWVTLVSVGLGCVNAVLFERVEFRGKELLYLLMLLPLVIPGVILGVSILVFYSGMANDVSRLWGIELDLFRPGLTLVVMGQVTFITTLATLVIAARLRKFDRQLEEAALNLGATPVVAWFTVTLPWLLPSILGAAAMSFLMSFENFNTTVMLTGSDTPLTVALFNRLREGSTPVLNAVALFLMAVSALLALFTLRQNR